MDVSEAEREKQLRGAEAAYSGVVGFHLELAVFVRQPKLTGLDDLTNRQRPCLAGPLNHAFTSFSSQDASVGFTGHATSI